MPHKIHRSMSYGLILISSATEAPLRIHAHVSISKESVGLPVESSFIDVLPSLINACEWCSEESDIPVINKSTFVSIEDTDTD